MLRIMPVERDYLCDYTRSNIYTQPTLPNPNTPPLQTPSPNVQTNHFQANRGSSAERREP